MKIQVDDMFTNSLRKGIKIFAEWRKGGFDQNFARAINHILKR